MSGTQIVEIWQLRAHFAAALSQMYGTEVPAYTTLVDVSAAVNRDYVRAHPEAERLGSLQRVTAERHGAIRVGTPGELADAADLFAAFGMFPVGFYDLREAASPVPVVSTAFRPVDAVELARNPFRVFTSMLATADPRFFDADLRPRVERALAARTLFDPELIRQAREIAAAGGCSPASAGEFVRRAVAAFALSDAPIDRRWYEELTAVSAVAADIAGVGTTHINHLTPRVLDIDDQMAAQGLAYYQHGDPTKPIVYEDFLPASAAGIFRSNLDSDTRAGAVEATEKIPAYNQQWMADAIGRDLHDPYVLYEKAAS